MILENVSTCHNCIAQDGLQIISCSLAKLQFKRDKLRHKSPVEGFRNTDLVLMIALSWLAEQGHSLAVVLNSFYV